MVFLPVYQESFATYRKRFDEFYKSQISVPRAWHVADHGESRAKWLPRGQRKNPPTGPQGRGKT